MAIVQSADISTPTLIAIAPVVVTTLQLEERSVITDNAGAFVLVIIWQSAVMALKTTNAGLLVVAVIEQSALNVTVPSIDKTGVLVAVAT